MTLDEGQTEPRVEMVDPRTARRWIERDEAVLVDVREPQEYAMGHVDGAISLPLSVFDPARLPDATGKRLVIMCASGVRCGVASAILLRTGYPKLYRMAGGIMAWTAGGGPIVHGR